METNANSILSSSSPLDMLRVPGFDIQGPPFFEAMFGMVFSENEGQMDPQLA